MALQNPSTLYTENQGIFDSKPYLRMGQQLNQQKEARDAALNKYNQTLGDKINGAGLNYDDIEGLDTRVKNFQDYFKGNSKQINKGNTPEKQQYDLLIRDAQSYVEKGKAKMKDAAQLFAFQNQKGNEDVNLDHEFAETVHLATLPLDKGYKPANMIKVMRPPKTFDDNEHTIAMEKLKPATFKEIITPYPNDDTKDNVTKIPEFTKEQDDQIKAHATGEYGTNRSYHRKVDELVKDPGIKQLFSTVYKNQYGIEATHPEDFAIAYDLSKIQKAPQTRVRVTNAERVRGQNMADAKTKIEWQEAKSKRLIVFNASHKPTEDNNNGYISDSVASSAGENVKITGEGERRVIYVDKVDPERLQVIVGKAPGANGGLLVAPIPIQQPDGTKRLGYFQDQTTGDWEGQTFDGMRRQSVSSEAAKDRYTNKISSNKFKARNNSQAREERRITPTDKAALQKTQAKSDLKVNVR